MEFAAQPVAPGVIHADNVDPIDGKVEIRALELAMQHETLLRQLLGIGDVLQLASAAAGREVWAGRRNSGIRRVENVCGLRSPEILAPLGDLGLDRLPWDGPFDKHHPAVDPCQGRPAVGEFANRQLHYEIFSRSSASSRWGLARPLEIFMPWPIRNLSACSFPALKSATDFTFSAMTWATIWSSSASPLIWVEPRAVSSAGPGSGARYMASKVCFAILPVIAPESISEISCWRSGGLIDASSISLWSRFSSRLKSPRIQLAAVLAGAPRRTVSSKNSAIEIGRAACR